MNPFRAFPVLLLVCAPLLCASPLPPSFQWARRVAGTTNTDNELSIGMTLDSQGNAYVTGWFDGTNDFGGVTLTNTSGGGQDIFVAKYNPTGALQWARRAGGNTSPISGRRDEGRDAGRGVGVDNAGNVYATGGFFGTADFGSTNLTASGNRQCFLAKYDSAGTVQWVRQSTGGHGGADGIYGTGLAVDGVGNSVAVGFAGRNPFSDTTLGFGTTNLLLPSTNGFSTFLIKHDNAGTVQWAQLLRGAGQTYATKVAVDVNGNAYVRGSFETNLSIGTSNLVSSGAGSDMFVAKFNSSGALTWVRQAGGNGFGEGGVVVDQSGSVYVTGSFGGGSVDFGGTILTSEGPSDAFIAKYSNSGVLQWARRAGGGGPDFDFYWDAALDGQGNVYAAGFLSPGAVAAGSAGAMVAKYDPAGTLLSTSSASGPPANPVSSVAAKVAVDSVGNAYLAGWYLTNTTFGTNVLQSQGYWNFFLTQLATVSDKTVVAWGRNDFGQTNIPTGLAGVIAVAAGSSHSVALKRDGTVAAWGDGSFGQTNMPPSLSGVTAIAAGSLHTLALKGNGTVVAWGVNSDGQTTVPVGLTDVVAVAAGWAHSVALKRNGTVVAWGATTFNPYGQADVPAGLTNVVAIAAGESHTVALKNDGTVVAWGRNQNGQTNVPVGLSEVSAIAAGYSTMALKSNGTVVVWGGNPIRTQVPAGLANVTAIAGGYFHLVALKGDGTVVVWGDNGSGQTNVPAGLNGVTALAAGSGHTLALAGNGVVTPAISAHPQNQTMAAATNLNLSVAAVGATGFQWLFNGAPIAGQTNAALSLGGLRRTNSGSYSVIVMGAGGSVTSSPALVRVQVPQRVTPQAQPPGAGFRLAFQDSDGGVLSTNDVPNFEVHYTTNFNTLNTLWLTNAGGFTVTNGVVFFNDAGSTGSVRRFYRVIER